LISKEPDASETTPTAEPLMVTEADSIGFPSSDLMVPLSGVAWEKAFCIPNKRVKQNSMTEAILIFFIQQLLF